MDNIINSLDAFFGDYFGINFPNVQITDIVEIIIIAFFHLSTFDLGAEHKDLDALSRSAGCCSILYFGSPVPDEYDPLAGRKTPECGIDHGDRCVPAGTP